MAAPAPQGAQVKGTPPSEGARHGAMLGNGFKGKGLGTVFKRPRPLLRPACLFSSLSSFPYPSRDREGF